MTTEGYVYFTDIIDHLNKYNDRQGQIFSSKKVKESVLTVMEEEKEEIERNINIITCDTVFQFPITMNVQKKDAN